MSPRRYLLLMFGSMALPLAALGVANAVIDPFWFFPHESHWYTRQVAFDERQQKTNRVAFQPFGVEAILIGTSRTNYIDEAAFEPVRTLNFGLAGLWPEEYREYLAYAMRRSIRPVTTIFLGVDFYSGPERVFGADHLAPSHYFETASSPFYRVRTLLSFDTWRKAYRNIELSRAGAQNDDYYDRRSHSEGKPLPDSLETARRFLLTLRGYRDQIYVPGYRYDRADRALFADLRATFPDARFVVFVTPLSPSLFDLLVAEGKLPEYEEWLADLVDVFGQVYDFGGMNTITRDVGNFHDATHFRREIGSLIAHRLTGQPDPALPDDFGVVVDAANLGSRIEQLRGDAVGRDPDPVGTAERRYEGR